MPTLRVAVITPDGLRVEPTGSEGKQAVGKKSLTLAEGSASWEVGEC